MKPVISVLLPTLNVADYIDECIESVMQQTFSMIEILIIDAGSTDGTLEKIYNHMKTDARIKLIMAEEKSYGYQLNLGMDRAVGDYIAIVETDDYIEHSMLKNLYEVVENNDLDYAKGNFEWFDTITTTPFYQWGNDSSYYNKVINAKRVPDLFYFDNNHWRGLYRKEFLEKNEIRFNETKGAAFQDIGFNLQILAFHKRSMYINQSLYRYRINRPGASTTTNRRAIFVYQEYKWLNDECHVLEKVEKSQLQGMVVRLASCFLGELGEVLKECNCSLPSLYDPVIQYMQDALRYRIENGDIVPWQLPDAEWRKLIRFSYNYDSYLFEEKAKNDNIYDKTDYWNLMLAGNKNVIVFGAGNYGKSVLFELIDSGANVIAIIDNEPTLWGKMIEDICIVSPEECREKYRNSLFVIAKKNDPIELYEQLMDMDIPESNIYYYNKW